MNYTHFLGSFCASFLVSLLMAAPSFGHGDDKPGPHGGQIQMPGAFHTEVVASHAGLVKVYLLDIDFKNPVVKDSSVSLEQRIGKMKPMKINCKPSKDHFACGALDINSKGSLIVRAKRSGQVGNEAEYSLPLKH